MKKIRKKIENWIFDLFENSEKKEQAIERFMLFFVLAFVVYVAVIITITFLT